jgi:hypothetical protein
MRLERSLIHSLAFWRDDANNYSLITAARFVDLINVSSPMHVMWVACNE